MYLTDRINSELSFESVSIKCFYGSLINSGSDFCFRSSNHLTDQIPILAYGALQSVLQQLPGEEADSGRLGILSFIPMPR